MTDTFNYHKDYDSFDADKSEFIIGVIRHMLDKVTILERITVVFNVVKDFAKIVHGSHLKEKLLKDIKEMLFEMENEGKQ